MLWVGFEPTSPVSKRAKTVHALDCSPTVTGRILLRWINLEGCNGLNFIELTQVKVCWRAFVRMKWKINYNYNFLVSQATTLWSTSILTDEFIYVVSQYYVKLRDLVVFNCPNDLIINSYICHPFVSLQKPSKGYLNFIETTPVLQNFVVLEKCHRKTPFCCDGVCFIINLKARLHALKSLEWFQGKCYRTPISG
jgi:hypothetical protein